MNVVQKSSCKILKDSGNIKVSFFFFFVQEWKKIPDAMVLCKIYATSNNCLCRQQSWPYKILNEKLQELSENPNFIVTLVFEYFCSFDFSTTFNKLQKRNLDIL